MPAYVIVDAPTGEVLHGQPDSTLAAASTGEAWQPTIEGNWQLRRADDPPMVQYRLVQVVGGPAFDPDWYENTVENLDTSEDQPGRSSKT